MVWNDVPHASVTGQGPLGGTQSWVRFTPLELAHAVVKADAARSLPAWTVYRRAWGFLLHEWGDALVPSNGNLRLNAEGYVDFVGTSLVGRLGQGLALLYAQRQGYTYVGHYAQVVAGGGRRSSAGGPDFVLEKSRGGTRALLEAKGARDRRDVRRRLGNAMTQIKAGFATTNAHEGYVTAAILQEVDDRSDSEGFVARVPNAQYRAQPMGERVARVNYGTWIRSMGLFGLATRLLRGPEQAQVPEESVATLEVGGMAVAFQAFWPTLFFPPVWWWRHPPPLWEDLLVLAFGLGLANLRSLAASVREGREVRTDQLEVAEARVHEAHDGLVSVFSDTTAFGLLPARALETARRVTV
jgi:hypothetical protein